MSTANTQWPGMAVNARVTATAGPYESTYITFSAMAKPSPTKTAYTMPSNT